MALLMMMMFMKQIIPWKTKAAFSRKDSGFSIQNSGRFSLREKDGTNCMICD